MAVAPVVVIIEGCSIAGPAAEGLSAGRVFVNVEFVDGAGRSLCRFATTSAAPPVKAWSPSALLSSTPAKKASVRFNEAFETPPEADATPSTSQLPPRSRLPGRAGQGAVHPEQRKCAGRLQPPPHLQQQIHPFLCG